MQPWKRYATRSLTKMLLGILITQNKLGLRFVDLLLGEWRWLHSELLKKRLLACGNNCGFNFPFRIEGPEFVSFGESISIAPYVHIWGQGGVWIGDHTMIASHVVITSVTHNKKSTFYKDENVCLPVRIGKNVWIGAHAVILPGLEIGDDAIIGAGAVVTRNVPPRTIVAGIPARSISEIS
jgi:maltose O-acetyltransferase